MSEPNRRYVLYIRRGRRAERGQTLIIAIAVLFILLFIGGVFVAEIAQNLFFTGRSSQTQAADALAEAGIRYCDTELTHSALGADWRPAPTPPQFVTDPDYEWLSQGFTRVAMNGGRALVRVVYDPHADDPRSQYLRIESVGRPGSLAGAGGSIDPTVFVQQGGAPRLRSERLAYKAIGITDYSIFITDKTHSGVEDALGWPASDHNVAFVVGDPTTAETGANPTGISPNGSNLIVVNGGVRCNANLRLWADFFLYAGARGNVDSQGNAIPALSPEGMQVAGQILNGPTRDVNGDGVIGAGDYQAFCDVPINYTGLVNNPVNDPLLQNNIIRPSNDPLFTSVQGYVRDGNSGSDVNGYTRAIPRLEPPTIAEKTDGSGVLRYRALTRDSGTIVNINGAAVNTGQFGLGTGIYVNNPTDLQRETAKPGINGGYSLRSDWLNPHANIGGYWQEPYYRPPGTMIDLKGDHLVLTRDDNSAFLKPDGTPIDGQGGKVIDIPLDDARRAAYTFPDGTAYVVNNAAGLPPLPHGQDDPSNTNPRPYGDPNSYGVDVVLMAEGNVRVRGTFGALTNKTLGTKQLGRVHLTIVTGGTAYIEGNLLKGDGYFNGTDGNGNPIGLNYERKSTLAILAKDYVAVNTTMFVAPENQVNVQTNAATGLDFPTSEIGLTKSTYDSSFSFGVDPSTYQSTYNGITAPTAVFLMLRGAALYPGPSYLDLLINPALNNPAQIGPGGANAAFNYPDSTYVFNDPASALFSLLGFAYGVSMKYTLPQGAIGTGSLVQDTLGVAPYFEARAFPLVGGYEQANGSNYFVPLLNGWSSYFPTLLGVNPAANSAPLPGAENTLRLQLDPTAQSTTGTAETDYLLAGIGVAPLDIRIEALLYAENKSFFVIPGLTFNTDPNDTRAAYNSNGGARPSYSGLDSAADRYAKDLVPFYNEPMDVRITIYGAVAENYTPSIGDQAASLAKWGYIPASFGSSAADQQGPGRVPDAHLRVHDPAGYNPAEDQAADFRTPFESQNPAANLPGQYADFELTRGLRFVYDPALALPYYAPNTPITGDGNTSQRAQQALRYNYVPAVQLNGTTLMNAVFQTLPPIPRLPVCPGLLYFGSADTPIQ